MYNMLLQQKECVALLAAIMVPVITMAAIQQRKINSLSDDVKRLMAVRLDKKFIVYQKISAFISSMLINGKLKKGATVEFLINTKDVPSLFGPGIAQFTDEVHRKAVELQYLQSKTNTLPSRERNEVMHREQQIKDWLSEQLNKIRELFADELELK